MYKMGHLHHNAHGPISCTLCIVSTLHHFYYLKMVPNRRCRGCLLHHHSNVLFWPHVFARFSFGFCVLLLFPRKPMSVTISNTREHIVIYLLDFRLRAYLSLGCGLFHTFSFISGFFLCSQSFLNRGVRQN